MMFTQMKQVEQQMAEAKADDPDGGEYGGGVQADVMRYGLWPGRPSSREATATRQAPSRGAFGAVERRASGEAT